MAMLSYNAAIFGIRTSSPQWLKVNGEFMKTGRPSPSVQNAMLTPSGACA